MIIKDDYTVKVLKNMPVDQVAYTAPSEYSKLRNNLASAFGQGAWGIEIDISGADKKELDKKVAALAQAAKTWERSNLKKMNKSMTLHYKKLSVDETHALLRVWFTKETEAKPPTTE